MSKYYKCDIEKCCDRRQAFINDFVQLLKKYRVTLETDEVIDIPEINFTEHSNCPSGYNFEINLYYLEPIIRNELWSVVHEKG